jgi:hypothetical protein
MSWLILVLMVGAGAFADRIRGTGDVWKDPWGNMRNGEVPGALIVGVIFTVLFGAPWWAVLVFALAWKIGESIGWSDIMGAPARGTLKMLPENIETWQVGILGTNWWAAAIVRGAIWGLPMALATYLFVPLLAKHIFLAYVIGFVASPLIAMKLKKGWDSWVLAEWIRGGLTIALIVLFMHNL